MQLSEYTANVIENLACRAAQSNGGAITPHAVLPYPYPLASSNTASTRWLTERLLSPVLRTA